jgi:predicted naringenin-chalcone synthase
MLLGAVTLATIAFVHQTNPRTMVVATALFATAIAAVLTLATVENLPFAGEISVHPSIYQHLLVSGT